MLRRLAISIDDKELERIQDLQKRFHISNRSEFFRELVKRYDRLEGDFNGLQRCLTGYLNQPESVEEAGVILKAVLKGQRHEGWR